MVYSVKFKNDNKTYNYKSDVVFSLNDFVIVPTGRGLQYGKIVRKNLNGNEDNLELIERLATKDDYEIYLDNLKLAKEALETAKTESEKLDLKMNFIDSSFSFDKKQLLLTYFAEERIDFRELAKKLASIYKTRIELYQIGTRDKAKKIGGCGLCGQELCCSRFLNHLNSVSINMAKNQNLALNPNKINGVCGRLLCCLAYEDDVYVACRDGIPSINQKVNTIDGEGKVVSIDILNRKYTVDVDGKMVEVVLNEESN
ncbi:MAG: stage 0 sporulation protein [Bacilli bacterium]|nr:stage 0 sporulation protein [Bacilli bacterium]